MRNPPTIFMSLLDLLIGRFRKPKVTYTHCTSCGAKYPTPSTDKVCHECLAF